MNLSIVKLAILVESVFLMPHSPDPRHPDKRMLSRLVQEDQGDIRVQDPARHHQALRGSAALIDGKVVRRTMKRPTQAAWYRKLMDGRSGLNDTVPIGPVFTARKGSLKASAGETRQLADLLNLNAEAIQ